MEMTKEPQRGRELGGHDGDDDDGDGRVDWLLARLTLSGQFLSACTSARLHGMSFEEIRDAFEGQLALVITTENAVSSALPKEEAIEKVEATTAALVSNVYAKDDAKKDRFEGIVFVRQRVEAIVMEAAVTAMGCAQKITEEQFVACARAAYSAAHANYAQQVEIELRRYQFSIATASEKPKTQGEET